MAYAKDIYALTMELSDGIFMISPEKERPMKKNIVFLCSIIIMLSFFISSQATAETKVINFNGEVKITVMKDGKPTEESAVLQPGEALVSQQVLNNVSLKKATITWKDIAEYEQQIVAREAYSRLFIDNSWAKRINETLDMFVKKYGKIPTLDKVLEALGIPKNRPSGKGVYKLIPGPDSPDPASYSRVYYLDENLNEYLDPGEKIADSLAEETMEKNASRSD